jgi:hypothetical protein
MWVYFRLEFFRLRVYYSGKINEVKTLIKSLKVSTRMI